LNETRPPNITINLTPAEQREAGAGYR